MNASSRRLWPLAILCAASLAGCPGSASRSSAPANLSASAGWSFDDIELRWDPPAGQFDGYELEGRIEASAWEKLHDGLIPPDVIGATLTLVSTVPELTNFTFRIRSVRGGSPSAYGNEAPFLRGVRPPTDLVVSADTYGPITATWTNASSVATALRVERTIGPAGGGAVTWTPLPATFGATSYGDWDVLEGTPYRYRVAYGCAGTWSAWTETWSTAQVVMLRPTGLSATSEAGGLRLRWVNHSAIATELSVDLGGQSVMSGLSPSSTEALVPFMSLWPGLQLKVVAQGPNYIRAPSAGLPLDAYAFPGAPPFQVSKPGLPPASLDPRGPVYLARGADGRYHLVATASIGDPFALPYVSIHRPVAGGWDEHRDQPALQPSSPGVRLDGAGLPHAVFNRCLGDCTALELVHAWHDGAGWLSEVVPVPEPSPFTAPLEAWFEVEPGGRLHVVYLRADPAGVGVHLIVHGTVGDAGWVWTELRPAPTLSATVHYAGGPRLAMAADGTLLVGGEGYFYSAEGLGTSRYVLFQRAPDGAWTQEEVPTGEIEPGSGAAPATWPGGVGIAFARWSFGDPLGHEIRVVRKDGATWGDPELVMFRPHDGRGVAARASADTTGRMYLVLANVFEVGTQLYLRGAEGWTGRTLAPYSWLYFTGADPTGRAWALVWPNAAITPEADWPAEFLETTR